MPVRPPYRAIAGLGLTPMSRVWMGNSVVLAAKAIQLALEDAGLTKDNLDELLINSGVAGMGAPGASRGSRLTRRAC
jgi:acetyl-CoA acetyltransferase